MQIAIAEAKAHFAEIIRRAEAGEDIHLTRHGKPVAKIVPADIAAPTSLLGCMKGRFELSDDFSSSDEAVAELFGLSSSADR